MANQIWTDPRTWETGLLKTSAKNTDIRDNMNYLFKRNRVVFTERGATDTTSTTPFTTQTLTTHGNDLLISLRTHYTNAGSNACKYDVRIDLGGGGSVYASSGTGTPATNGAYQVTHLAGAKICITFSILVTGIPAGTHNFVVVAAGTGLTTAKTNSVSQLVIEEYGIVGTNKVFFTPTLNWVNGMNVTKSRLNEQVRDNLDYLYERNYVVQNLIGTAYSTTSTSFVTVGVEKLRLKTDGRDVKLSLLAPLYTASINASIVYIDVLIDDEYYLSSLTNTPLSDGWINISSVTNFINSFYNEHILKNIDAGWHSFELYFKTSTASSAAVIHSLSPTQFMAEEIGIRS